MPHTTKTKHTPTDAEAIRINEIASELADMVVQRFNNTLLEDFTAYYEQHVETAWALWCKDKHNEGVPLFDGSTSFFADAELIRERVCECAVEILSNYLGVSFYLSKKPKIVYGF
jgi:hypothetical protein